MGRRDGAGRQGAGEGGAGEGRAGDGEEVGARVFYNCEKKSGVKGFI